MSDKKKFFVEGRCVFCATKECTELCYHYGALVCRKTLQDVGEKLYMQGQEELGVKYYAMAEYAKQTQIAQRTTAKRCNVACSVKHVASGPRESIKERFLREEAVRASLGPSQRSGMFGVFAPKPVNRSSAMSFQKRH